MKKETAEVHEYTNKNSQGDDIIESENKWTWNIETHELNMLNTD